MLAESLKKKDGLLGELLSLSRNQTDALNEENTDWDAFDTIVDKKNLIIEEINLIDEGFETLFARVKGEINANRAVYAGEIATMQVLIKSVTEKSADIEAVEKRNKVLIESKFAETRKNIKQSKLGNKAAAQYYQRMNKINVIDPQLMDKKS